MDAEQWEAVFWDIGGVILDLESVRTAHREFLAALLEDRDGAEPLDDAIVTWREAVGSHFRERDGTSFRSAREGYAKGVEAVAGERLPPEAWQPDFESVLASSIEPVPGAVETVERLTDRDVHLGIVSDVDADEGRRILETFGIRSRFDSITTSEEVGRTKPDPAMFETALSAADVEPPRALMIGDRYEHDVAGANERGLQTAGLGLDPGAGPALNYPIASPREVIEIVDGEWTEPEN